MIKYTIWYEMDALSPYEEQLILAKDKYELHEKVKRYIGPQRWGILKIEY